MRASAAGTGTTRRFLVVNIAIAAVAWVAWLVAGRTAAVQSVADNWQIALTMILGSLVGGGTSEGGGAVAFPILTKLLAVPADTARVFTFAIQGVGMTAASVSILANRVPVERRVLVWGVPSGIVGVVLSIMVVAQHLSPRDIRLAFTILVTALALALVVQGFGSSRPRALRIPVWSDTERVVVVISCFAGGFLSGLAGVGIDTIAFAFLVLLFGVSEKVATPTTVILMASVSIVAFAVHVSVVGSFHGPVVGYWLAGVPVVVVGAPLGAWICTRMSPAVIRGVLVGLIAVEFVSTILLVPLSAAAIAVSSVALLAGLGACLAFTRVPRYHTYGRPGLSRTGLDGGLELTRR